jgi:hypothetical protein
MSNAPVTPIQPLVRLALSRSRLSVALHRLHAVQDHTAKEQPHPPWMDGLRADPTTRIVLDALAVWWARQPWQQSATLLGSAVRQLLTPLAQRNPLRLVLGAFAVGAVVMLTKPWRWISLPALAAGLLPQLIIKLTELAQPLSWIEVLQAWLKPTPARTSDDEHS